MAFKKSLSALIFALPVVLGLTVKRVTTTAALNPKCDFLKPIAEDLLDNLFTNECGDAAHGALRLVFHDAIGIDPIAGGGGADGSILTFNATELTFPANDGLDDVLDDLGPFFEKFKDVLSPGDFVQFAGALSLAACPGAPQVQFLLGRPQPKAASPPNLVPEPFDDVTKILARFEAAGKFSPQEVVALLSSHSIAGADTVDPTIPGTPFDSTPSVFDTNIFIEVLLNGFLFPGTAGNQGEVMSSIAGTLRLESDDLIARDARTACFWQDLATNQVSMKEQFGAALFKLSLLGQNEFELTDCSAIIPAPPSLNDVLSFPPGQTIKDIDQSCDLAKFPNLPTLPGPPLVVPAIPQAETGDDS
jgi:cytochrome c peroxidase